MVEAALTSTEEVTNGMEVLSAYTTSLTPELGRPINEIYPLIEQSTR